MIAIKVQNLTKVYPLYNSPKDRLKEALHPFRKKYHHDFYALRDVSFEVQKGETVGIIGQNGSGKSTLLKVITGVLSPTSGSVEVNGRISSLLELGTGFNPELTGIENVYFYGTINGFTHEEMEEKIDAILGFADIGEFIYQPVKTYSSGMFVRLAFACAIQINPEILIVDEALAVGDARFQARCFERLRKIKENGCTLLLVTHATEQIVTHCNIGILLNHGKVFSIGEPKRVVNEYLDLLFGKEIVSNHQLQNEKMKLDQENLNKSKLNILHEEFTRRPMYNSLEYRWGDGKVQLLDFSITADGRYDFSSIRLGQIVRVEVSIKVRQTIMSPIFGFTLKSKEGITITGSNSEISEISEFRDLYHPEDVIMAYVEFECKLAGGDYFISLGIASKLGDDIVPHDRRYDAIHFVVKPEKRFYGLIDLNIQMGSLNQHSKAIV